MGSILDAERMRCGEGGTDITAGWELEGPRDSQDVGYEGEHNACFL